MLLAMSLWLERTCLIDDLGACLQGLLYERSEALGHMPRFDWATSVADTAQAVVMMLSSCGYPLNPPREEDPSVLGGFLVRPPTARTSAAIR